MSIIERQIKKMRIGPGQKKNKSQFFIASDELIKTIKSIYNIRKKIDHNWLKRFQEEIQRATGHKNQLWSNEPIQ